jgi:hypothetical protein
VGASFTRGGAGVRKRFNAARAIMKTGTVLARRQQQVVGPLAIQQGDDVPEYAGCTLLPYPHPGAARYLPAGESCVPLSTGSSRDRLRLPQVVSNTLLPVTWKT